MTDVESHTATFHAKMRAAAPVRPGRQELVRAQRARAAALRTHGLGKRRTAERIMRMVDVVIAFALAPVAVLAIALAGIAIKLDSPGPVFFKHQRTGLDGRRFRMWKLRTMVVDAEDQKADLAAQNRNGRAAFKLANDPRVTRVGRILRRIHVDELPQLWNVLWGDMGLVGPRPNSAGVDAYQTWQTARLTVRPGLTGAWQVMSSKNEMPFDERVRVDIQYLRNRTVAGDVRLIIRTATHAVGRGQGV